MPQYNYRCRSCDYEFSEIHRIDDRKIPESQPCPGCAITGEVYQMITAPVIGYSVAPNLRTTNNFNDRLKEMRKNFGRDNTVGDSIR